MATEVDLATAVATELVKQVPIKEVYREGLSPAVIETGGVLADFVKTIRLALAPLQFTAALQDRYVRFLDRSVRGIPEDDRVMPAPQILGPVLEAIKYEPDGSLLSDMYNELLARSFDRNRSAEAHPAYAAIIKQLSVDEAMILHAIYSKHQQNRYYHYHFYDDYDRAHNQFKNRKIIADELPTDGLALKKNAPVYMEHLDKLGLASIMQYQAQAPVMAGSIQIGLNSFARYQLSAFGIEFMKAVAKKTSV